MNVASAQDALQLIRSHGLEARMNCVGPVLVGDKEKVTPDLLAVLRRWREEIIKELTPVPGRTWLWRFGQTQTEPALGHWQHPAGAWWYRDHGETEWRVVPGREEYAAGHSIPEPVEKA